MIVYVESNFVLELTLSQADAAPAEAILRLAEQKKLVLAFPTFALIEPYWTIKYRHDQRLELCGRLNRELAQLQRSTRHQPLVASLQPLSIAMADAGNQEFDLLESTLRRILAVGQAIEIDGKVFSQALSYQGRYGLSPLDAVIYASVIAHLERSSREEPKCFLSRNPQDFSNPEIRTELESYQCRYIAKFADGLSYIENTMESSTSPPS